MIADMEDMCLSDWSVKNRKKWLLQPDLSYRNHAYFRIARVFEAEQRDGIDAPESESPGSYFDEFKGDIEQILASPTALLPWDGFVARDRLTREALYWMTKVVRRERAFASVVKSLSKASTVRMRSFGLATKTLTEEEIADIRTVIYIRDLLGCRIEYLNLANGLMPKPASKSIDTSAIDISIRSNYPELTSVMDRYFNGL